MKLRISRLGVGSIAAATAVLLTTALVLQAAPRTSLVSKTSGGTPADGTSDVGEATALSQTGRLVVFTSTADNLPGGDGVIEHAYVRDMKTGKTKLVSKDNAGDPLGAPTDAAGISGNGRYVAFTSIGAGLPQANGERQVWVHDRRTRRTRLVSKAPNGAPADSSAGDPSLSLSGRRIAFSSGASNLPGAEPLESKAYVRDLKTKRTLLVSRTRSGGPAQGSLYGQTISSNGRRVTFYSSDEDLTGGGSDSHVYVRDLKRRRTITVDRNAAGEPADGNGGNSSISGNGRFVAFESDASNLPGAGASSNQVYVRDLKRRKTKLGGRNSAGAPQNGSAEFAHLSATGRILEFVSSATNLPGGTGAASYTYVRDLRRGKTKLASRAPGGGPPDGEAQNASLSLDGRFVAFESPADNLGGNTTVTQVFRGGPFNWR